MMVSYDSDRPDVFIKTIGPDEAKIMLQKNKANFRRLDEARIVRYAKEMSAGRWQFDGAPIRFDIGGMLIDGQHRLKAIIKSGVPVQLVVVVGLKADGSTVDRGKPRTVAQWLYHHGIKNANVVAAAARLCCAHNNGLWDRVAHGSGDVVDGEVIAFATSNREKLYSAVRMASTAKAVLTPSIGSCIAYMGAGDMMPESNDTVVWFFKALADGANIDQDDAVFHLRSKLLSQRPGSRISPSMTRWITTKAWNKTAMGETCTAAGLRIRSTGPSKDKAPDKILPATD